MSYENICNICGANYVYRNGRWICPACGAYKAEELSSEEVTLLYNAAQKLRLADFGEAELAYDDIVQKYPQNAEGYWGRLLSRYGIKYEEDFDGKKIPTCYATTIESVMGDRDYQRALELAEPDMQVYYARQANYIERVRKEWVEKASREAPYDVFICYKDSDLANGIDRTQDSIAAQELYIHLAEQGYRVFFSRESLRDKVGEKYEPYIFNALSTAKVMLVYGTNPEFITSTWLKNEWTRYEKRIRAGEKQEGSLVTICDGFSPGELPRILATAQCFDATKRSFYGDLDKYVKKYVHGEEKPAATATTAQMLSGMPDQAQLERILRQLAEEDAEKQAKQAERERIAAEKQAESTKQRHGKVRAWQVFLLALACISMIVFFVWNRFDFSDSEALTQEHSVIITFDESKNNQELVSGETDIESSPVTDFVFRTSASGAEVSQYIGAQSVVRIPDTFNGKPVTVIGEEAFASCGFIETLILPKSLTTIELRAFSGCTSIASLQIPASVTLIRYGVFLGWGSHQEICFQTKSQMLKLFGSSELDSYCEATLVTPTERWMALSETVYLIADNQLLTSIITPAFSNQTVSFGTSLQRVWISSNGESIVRLIEGGSDAYKGRYTVSSSVLTNEDIVGRHFQQASGSVIALDNLNLREYATTASDVIGTIPKNVVVKIISKGEDWCKVEYNGTTGFVVSQYLSN